MYTNFIVLGLTKPWIEITFTIYHTQGEHATHYTMTVDTSIITGIFLFLFQAKTYTCTSTINPRGLLYFLQNVYGDPLEEFSMID